MKTICHHVHLSLSIQKPVLNGFMLLLANNVLFEWNTGQLYKFCGWTAPLLNKNIMDIINYPSHYNNFQSSSQKLLDLYISHYENGDK